MITTGSFLRFTATTLIASRRPASHQLSHTCGFIQNSKTKGMRHHPATISVCSLSSSASVGDSSIFHSIHPEPWNDNQERTIRWGILSAGKIAADFANALQLTPGTELVAVAARSLESSREFAKKYQIPTFYGSYDELLADPNVDVIYIGSVAQTHFEWAKKALLADKATLVEKPLALTTTEVQELVSLSKERKVFLHEGMWTRNFPAIKAIRQLIAGSSSSPTAVKNIGTVVAVQGDFGWNTLDCEPNHRIFDPQAGGLTLDLGMYVAQIGQVAYPGATLQSVHAVGNLNNGVDNTVLVNLVYDVVQNGKKGQAANGFLQFFMTGEANTEERIVIQGTEGRITITPPAHVPTSIILSWQKERGKTEEIRYDFPLPECEETIHWNYPGSLGFSYQIQDVNHALRASKTELDMYTHSDTIQVSAILEQIVKQVHAFHGDEN